PPNLPSRAVGYTRWKRRAGTALQASLESRCGLHPLENDGLPASPSSDGFGFSGDEVDLAAGALELFGFFAEALGDGGGLVGGADLGGVVPHVLGDLHGAEVRAAHRAEVGDLGPRRGQGLVVELARRLGIERQVELILPAELEAGLG